MMIVTRTGCLILVSLFLLFGQWFQWNCVDGNKVDAVEAVLPVPMQLDLGQSNSEELRSSACDRVRTGQTSILTIGSTATHFVLITTDLFVFVLESSQIDSTTIPPFTILINQPPSHMSHLYPRSYESFMKISNSILHSFVISNHQPGDQPSEYIVFVYTKGKGLECTLLIDIRADQPLEGLCDFHLHFYRFFSMIPFIPFSAIANPIEEHKRMCMIQTNFAKEDQTPCSTIDECKIIYLAGDLVGPMDDQLKQDICKPYLYEHQIVVAFSHNTSLYVIDGQHIVHTIDLIRAWDPVNTEPLDTFIGCNQEKPFSFTMDMSSTLAVAVVVIVLQLASCGMVYFVMRSMQGESLAQDGLTRKNSKSKGKRRKSSLRRDSKSRQSSVSRRSSISQARSNISEASQSKSRSSISRRGSTSRLEHSPTSSKLSGTGSTMSRRSPSSKKSPKKKTSPKKASPFSVASTVSMSNVSTSRADSTVSSTNISTVSPKQHKKH